MEITVLGIVAGLFGLLSLAYAMKAHDRAARARSWARAEGTVTHVSVKHAGSDTDTHGPDTQYYLPVVQYTYSVRGRAYSGNRMVIGEIKATLHEDVLELLRPYREGMKVAVFYDPSQPGYGVLEARADAGATTRYALIGIGLLAGAVYALFAVR